MKHILIGAVFFTPYNELSYSIFEGFESAMEDLKKVFLLPKFCRSQFSLTTLFIFKYFGFFFLFSMACSYYCSAFLSLIIYYNVKHSNSKMRLLYIVGKWNKLK